MGIQRKTYTDCQGCSLCLLPCPMWQQHRDVMFSPQGIAKAMQSGATATDVQEQAASCIHCGACDVMCPENIALSSWLEELSEVAGSALNQVVKEPKLNGFVISCDSWVQEGIHADDLYIIDAAPFHADYKRRVEHYTSLRIKTGCSMNLDLNRMAIPTGIGSEAAKQEKFNVCEQIQWLMQGREFARVIVENHDDMEVLRERTDKPVVCISELLPSLHERGEYATR
ncbi:MAG: 4Fe-4S dicluster domain-containing protein [Mariprofundaceae bacterium]|nr:4Fe-4S dicluster domain-containing protein [Mariprofundaceae bacterium]